MNILVLTPMQFLKAKYTRRWKGKDGRWYYEYARPKTERRPVSQYVVDPLGIAGSLQAAGKQAWTRRKKYAEKVGKLPIGSSFKANEHSWILKDLGGDRLWIRDDNSTGHSDEGLLTEFGQKVVDNLIAKHSRVPGLSLKNVVVKKKTTITVNAFEEGWKISDAKQYGAKVSAKSPDKYVTMHDVFGEVTFTIHNSLPKSVYAPGDFKYGYGYKGQWKDWSEKRRVTQSQHMVGRLD